uniref:Uncharacterized protein n=1 Tax=viral metagenome TaxID=1070528 RepID=A0A6C0CPH0_9ZZZZ
MADMFQIPILSMTVMKNPIQLHRSIGLKNNQYSMIYPQTPQNSKINIFEHALHEWLDYNTEEEELTESDIDEMVEYESDLESDEEEKEVLHEEYHEIKMYDSENSSLCFYESDSESDDLKSDLDDSDILEMMQSILKRRCDHFPTFPM